MTITCTWRTKHYSDKHIYYSDFLTNVFGTNANYSILQPLSISIFVHNNMKIEFSLIHFCNSINFLAVKDFQNTTKKIIKHFMELFNLKLDKVNFNLNKNNQYEAEYILVPDYFDDFMTLAKIVGITT